MNPLTFLKDFGNYKTRCVGRTELFGLIISTAYTSDEGYETAILDVKDVYPVERYLTKEDAIIGHEKWCNEAETITKVKVLGWIGLCPEREAILERIKY